MKSKKPEVTGCGSLCSSQLNIPCPAWSAGVGSLPVPPLDTGCSPVCWWPLVARLEVGSGVSPVPMADPPLQGWEIHLWLFLVKGEILPISTPICQPRS